jgi:hypothetical protein
MKNKAAQELGRLSHSRQSEAQSEASRENGKRGGRPASVSHDTKARSVTQVNRAIRHLGIEVVRGDGYFYFVSKDDEMIGCSVMVPYVNSMSLDRWIRSAESAIKEHNEINYEL